MLAYLLESLARDAPAARHVLEEGQHVVGLLGPAEGDNQQGVVGRDVGEHASILGSA